MFEFADIFLQKRRFVNAGIAAAIGLLFICLLAPVMQIDRARIAARVQSSYTSKMPQSMNDSPNAVTGALSQIISDTGRASNTMEVKLLSGIMALSTGITHFDKATVHGAQVAIMLTSHSVIGSVVFTGHAVGSVFTFVGRTIGDVFSVPHGLGLTHLSAIIQPQDRTPTPIITQLRIQQANLIQSGTMNVIIASMTSGIGGACDDGNGNGGYPMSWCNAPMDSISTILSSSEPINRECTSYAYWYFTSIEGHTDFRSSGNAKYWATTSNYPTHTTPAVGAIAVETTGTYGHVAIVQAVPGQKYAEQVVPAGYVLVSEMNYDWHGHFRYSYSPLSKFSAYIYP